ncbi:hypothetical protein Noc_1614 [Nitrosococcus oceani ATCC 19707]|uniref:DUF3330 domain-containing protein n=2 Tax=Nitrosococcus oceani TaxID=1229 RepID=Q3JAQ7_NITOC|nr:DUF3330 domain-containing protein [Nitrosococcus oceani]ABA58089.1 hypothetical protein Noc_1614 [Nitrosococcus oceani ATCC 19707]EDZ67737.1 hypothetical protein NOC27_1064 [Nitrosococcus oceani AFC27]KFI19418.1 hypothetical protein IB75_08550 [Nitrosococcus oceani C-27]GEM21258.1 hypothetical protein NONS58_26920 [Nitrosococcus oceani]
MTDSHERDPRIFSSEPKLNCDVCLKEIPQSEAQSAEAEEYVRWFCGLECYEQWRNDEKNKENPEEKKEA